MTKVTKGRSVASALAAAASAALLGSTAAANALTITDLGQVNPAAVQLQTELPSSTTGATSIVTGNNPSDYSWDPYGQGYSSVWFTPTQGPQSVYWGPITWTIDTTHSWVDVPNGSSATYVRSGASFEFIWGSPNDGNYVTFYNGATPVAELYVTKIATKTANSDYIYFINGDTTPAPPPPPLLVYNTPAPGYLIDITGVPQFTSVTLSMNGGDGGYFEFAVVPEPGTWAMMALGFASLGLLGRRSRAGAHG